MHSMKMALLALAVAGGMATMAVAQESRPVQSGASTQQKAAGPGSAQSKDGMSGTVGTQGPAVKQQQPGGVGTRGLGTDGGNGVTPQPDIKSLDKQGRGGHEQ